MSGTYGPEGRSRPFRGEPRSTVPLLIAGNVLFGAGLFFHAFLYNYYLEAIGHPETVMGNAAAALTAGGLIALLPAGRLSDRFGPRLGLLTAAALTTVGLLAGAFVTARPAVLVAAVAAGAGGGVWRVTVSPALMGVTTEATRPRAFAWNVGLLIASGGLGLAVAGSIPDAMTAWLGTDALMGIRVSLLLGAFASGVSGIAYLFVPLSAAGGAPRPEATARRAGPEAEGHAAEVPPGPEAMPEPDAWRRRLPIGHAARAVPDRGLALTLVALTVWMAGPALMAPFFNLYFTRSFDLGLTRVGGVFAGAHLLWGLVVLASGELAVRVGVWRLMAGALMAFTPIVWSLNLVEALPIAITLFVLQGAVSPVTNPLIDQMLLGPVAPERHGLVSSLRNAAADLAAIAGASIAGRVLSGDAFGGLLALSGGVGLVGAAALLLALRRWTPGPMLETASVLEAGAGSDESC